jgi:hypothetical protein
LRAILAAVLVAIFCRSSYYAIPFGIFSRTGPYRSVKTLLGKHANSLDPDAAAVIYSFRLRARSENVQYGDYEAFMKDVVLPIVETNGPDRIDRLKAAFAEMELSMPRDNPLPSMTGVPSTGGDTAP